MYNLRGCKNVLGAVPNASGGCKVFLGGGAHPPPPENPCLDQHLFNLKTETRSASNRKHKMSCGIYLTDSTCPIDSTSCIQQHQVSIMNRWACF